MPKWRRFKREKCKSDLIRPKARKEFDSMTEMEQELPLSNKSLLCKNFKVLFECIYRTNFIGPYFRGEVAEILASSTLGII